MSAGAPPPQIRQLDALVAEQIAAGEVVDRPASVAKELLENASDAGAGRVQLRYQRGGQLQVRDDGRGIPAGQMELALRRHATSKLRQLGDLDEIASYGFRGEALAAIASVARLRLQSRTLDEGAGHALLCEGKDLGKVQELDGWRPFDDGPAHGSAHGTVVTVDDLFFNTPARANFLRSDAAEERRVQLAAAQFAVTAPELDMAYWRDGVELWREPPCTGQDDLLRRVGRVLGGQDASAWVRLDATATDMQLQGWLCAPDAAARGRGSSLLMVNDRTVSSAPFAAAVRAGYEGLLSGAARPLYALWLRLPGRDVDVNVHPQKSEVRFRFDRALFGFVRSSVRRVLVEAAPQRAAPLAPASSRASAPAFRAPAPSGGAAPAPSGASTPAPGSGKAGAGHTYPAAPPIVPQYAREGGDPGHSTGGRDGEQMWKLFAQDAPDGGESGTAPLLAQAAPGLSDGRLLGMLHDTFLLVEVPAGLVVIDVQAAHERILYARMQRQWQEGGQPAQTLAPPLELRVAPAELQALESSPQLAGLLQDSGFATDAAAPDLVRVQSSPDGLPASWSERMVRAALVAAEQGGGPEAVRAALSDQRHEYLTDRARQAAHRSGQGLGEPEQLQFLRDMEEAEASGDCSSGGSQGRPGWNLVPMAALDRLCLRGQ